MQAVKICVPNTRPGHSVELMSIVINVLYCPDFFIFFFFLKT